MPDIEELKDGYLRRQRIRLAGLGALLPILWLFGAGFLDLFAGSDAAAVYEPPEKAPTRTFLSQIRLMRDTVYTRMPNILEIRLDSQLVYLHRRDSATITYKVSTGTERLDRGIKTRKGIFVVQNKIKWLYSIQFDSTKVFNWLGYNYGIGFHSLAGRGYFRHLGRRPSSHGCVRVGPNDAKAIFDVVEIGTPVMVHSGDYARTVAFLPPETEIDTASRTKQEVLDIYATCLRDLYKGEKLFRRHPIVPLDRQYIGHEGIPIGTMEKVPAHQKVPSVSNMNYTAVPLRTRIPEPKLKRWTGESEAVEKAAVEQTILP